MPVNELNITGLEAGRLWANRLDNPGHIPTKNIILRFRKSDRKTSQPQAPTHNDDDRAQGDQFVNVEEKTVVRLAQVAQPETENRRQQEKSARRYEFG